MKQIRVLELGMSSERGGVETYLIEQYRAFDKNRFSIDFVYNSPASANEMAFFDELIQSGSLVHQIVTKKDWRTLFQTYHYDVVVGNFCDIYFAYPLFIARRYKVPRIIFHSHNGGNVLNWLTRKGLSIYKRYIQRKLRRCGVELWACSRSAAQWMFGNVSDVTLIHNGIDVPRFAFNMDTREKVRRELGIDDRLVLGHVGRFAMQKNHLFILSVFSEVLKRNSNAVLLLVGQNSVIDDYMSVVLERIETLGIKENVYFLGSQADTSRLYQAMDYFLLPSLFEGFPIVGIEAQASGLPCFFSDTISTESTILPSTCFLPIQGMDCPSLWAETILSSGANNIQREHAWRMVQTAGYDVHSETRRVMELLQS